MSKKSRSRSRRGYLQINPFIQIFLHMSKQIFITNSPYNTTALRQKQTELSEWRFLILLSQDYKQVVTLYTVPYVSMCPDLSLLAQPCQSCGNTRVKHNICLRKKSWAGCIYMKSVRCPILYFHHHWAQQISTGSYIKKSVGSV